MWIDEHQVIPLYLFSDPQIREEWELFFNTHQKIQINNLSWSTPPQYKPLTAFELQLQNTSSRYIGQIELNIVLQNQDAQITQQKNIEIVGKIAPADSVTVGTLWDPKTQKMQYMTENHYKSNLHLKDVSKENWSPSINIDIQKPFTEIVVQAVFAEIQN